MVSTMLSGVKMRRWTAATWVTVTVCAVFFLGAYAGPGWVWNRQGLGHESIGLWQRCTRWSDLTTCKNIIDKLEGDPAWLNAVRAMTSLTGIGLIITILVFSITFCLQSSSRSCLLGFQAFLLIICFVLSLASLVVYGTQHQYAYSVLAYSFYFTVVVCFGCLLATIFTILDICQGYY